MLSNSKSAESQPQGQRCARSQPTKDHTVESVTEHLSDVRVSCQKDTNVEALAEAFDKKWSPNSTAAKETDDKTSSAQGKTERQ